MFLLKSGLDDDHSSPGSKAWGFLVMGNKQEQPIASSSVSNYIIYSIANTLLSFQSGLVSGYEIETRLLRKATAIRNRLVITPEQNPAIRQREEIKVHLYESPTMHSMIFYSTSLLQFPIECAKSYLIGKLLPGISDEQCKRLRNTGTVAYITGLSLGAILAKFVSIPRTNFVMPTSIPPQRARSAAQYDPEFEDDIFPAITDRI